MPQIIAYTDGACSGNPGPGGWGALLQAKDGDSVLKSRELKGGEAHTMDPRLETPRLENLHQKARQKRRSLASS